MDKPKKLILDYSKWRCGDDGDHSLGEGPTKLLNEYGFMCCLGQFGQQMGVPEHEMDDMGEPCECNTQIELFTEDNGVFVMQAISVNDEPGTTPEEKISAIRTLLSGRGIELEVINKP